MGYETMKLGTTPRVLPRVFFPPLPQAYLGALDFVQALQHDTGCSMAIAGGALRDLVIGRHPATDIDIFVFPGRNSKYDPEFLSKNFSLQTSSPYHLTNSSGPACSFRCVVPAPLKDRPALDVIFPTEQRDIFSMLESFDIGICQIAHNGSAWVVHEHFTQDLYQKVIRVHGPGAYTRESVLDRVKRFQERYPDFTTDTSFFDPQLPVVDWRTISRKF